MNVSQEYYFYKFNWILYLDTFVLSWSYFILFFCSEKNQGTEKIQNLPNFILQVSSKMRKPDSRFQTLISSATCFRRSYKMLRKYFHYLVFKFCVKVLNQLTVKYIKYNNPWSELLSKNKSESLILTRDRCFILFVWFFHFILWKIGLKYVAIYSLNIIG